MNPRTYDCYVLQIVKQGSLTKAAAEIGISQPALSAGLTSLENELGFRIFNRKTSPVTITPDGQLYIDYIRRLQVLSEDFEKRLDEKRGSAGSRVVIGGPVAYINSMVSDTVLRLLGLHPEYRVTLRTASLGELIEQAERGEVDCFISTSDKIPDRFEKRLIKKEKVYLCVPGSDPMNDILRKYAVSPGEKGKMIDFSILDGRSFICLTENQPLQIQLRGFAAEEGFAFESRIIVDQVSTAVRFAIKGLGLCFASEDALAGFSDLSGICLYSLPEQISGRAIYAAYDKSLFVSEACGSFMELLESDNKE